MSIFELLVALNAAFSMLLLVILLAAFARGRFPTAGEGVSSSALDSAADVLRAGLARDREAGASALGQLRGEVTTALGSVSDQLQQVYKGLGEMRALATNVGDLKRTLGSVTARGIWGEVRLEILLEQFLTAEQYAKDFECLEGSGERVEFAVRMSGGDEREAMWLPIDAKFPREDYERLLDATQRGDAAAAHRAANQLDASVRESGRKIREKYLAPPRTTPFALMFLPTEGLYMEVLRRPGLVDALQRECRITVAGPTTLSALLDVMRMGFRSMAVERRSPEVWLLLDAVKGEFEKFADILGKVQTKLQQASETIDVELVRRTKAIQRRLRDVESPSREVPELVAGTSLRTPGQEDQDFDESLAAQAPSGETQALEVVGEFTVRNCVECGREFIHPRQPGRSPGLCEDCRSGLPSSLTESIADSDEGYESPIPDESGFTDEPPISDD